MVMPSNKITADFDAAIVGGGPAGLSAAIVLGRACRSVIVFDHNKPRNYAARAVHCYLARDGIAPMDLRSSGRSEARAYGVKFIDEEIVAARCLSAGDKRLGGFELQTGERTYVVRTVLLATGVTDVLPKIASLEEFYGTSVHHCPYCDGWEHRNQRIIALGDGEKAADLALMLRTWSPYVTACSNGYPLSSADRHKLERGNLTWREQRLESLVGKNGAIEEVRFGSGAPLPCDALFFSSDLFQRSRLPELLDCKLDEDGCVQTSDKQGTGINGLYLAGDADGEVQFAIVAAAEGATAGVAINNALQEDDEQARS